MSKHICQTLMEYALSLGGQGISKLPGLWESKIDDTWTVKCNGHEDKIEGVPGFCWYIEYNGWPAGVLSITGEGVLCAGEGGNAENLRAAIEEKMKN